MKLIFDDNDLRSLKKLIEEEFGLSLKTHTQDTLLRKIRPRMKALNMNSVRDYLDFITGSPHAKTEVNNLPSVIMNTESYFMREFAQLSLLLELIMKKTKQKAFRSDRTIRILSAGCSEGQEPYSIAMLIMNNAHLFNIKDFKIYGLDVNTTAIEKAQLGVYSSYALRGEHIKSVEDYFQKIDRDSFYARESRFRLKPEVIRNVEFVHANILHPLTLKGFRSMDFIFCRNVLMYMSAKAVDMIALSIWEALSEDGHLFIGQSESLRKRDDLFTAVSYPETAVYRKNIYHCT